MSANKMPRDLYDEGTTMQIILRNHNVTNMVNTSQICHKDIVISKQELQTCNNVKRGLTVKYPNEARTSLQAQHPLTLHTKCYHS